MGRPTAELARREAEREAAAPIRTFATGATRDTDNGKLNYAGFLSVAVQRRYAEFMHRNRRQANGALRAADNWKKGIPRQAFIESMYRHFFEALGIHQGADVGDVEEALCALRFNVDGYLYESLKARGVKVDAPAPDAPGAAPQFVAAVDGAVRDWRQEQTGAEQARAYSS